MKQWTTPEQNRLAEAYLEGGIAAARATLPGRSDASITTRASLLNISRPTKNWTDREIQILREHYPKGGAGAAAARLPDRNNNAIRQKAREISLKKQRNYWSEEEVEFLRAHYSTLSKGKMANILNRTDSAIGAKASSLGLSKSRKKPERSFAWTRKEIEIIRAKYPAFGWKEVRKAMPHRTRAAIQTKAVLIGCFAAKPLESWSLGEKEMLKEHYPQGGVAAVKARIKRTKGAIHWMARKLGIARKINLWTEAEKETLRALYPSTKQKEIGRRLGRSIGSVSGMAKKLKLKKRVTKK